MSEVTGYKTREDFARSFVPAFKQALRMAERKAAGEKLDNDFEEWLDNLKAEAEKMRAEPFCTWKSTKPMRAEIIRGYNLKTIHIYR